MNQFNQQPKFLFEFPGVSFRKVALPATFATPPFSVELQSVFIDPNDVQSNPNTASSGDTRYNGTVGTGIPYNAVEPNVNTQTFESEATFDVIPPDNVNELTAGWFIASMFWAGGTLQLFITANSTQSFYRNRLVHYSLSLANGDWNFIYQPTSSQALREYIFNTSSRLRYDIHRYKSGVSQFFQINATVPFGDLAGYSATTTNNLRVSISDQGTFELSVYSVPAPGSSAVNSVLGDTVGVVSSGSSYEDLGTIDGGRYFRPSPTNDFVDGYPLPAYPSISTIENLRNYNMYVDRFTEADNVIYHGLTEIYRYKSRGNSSAIKMYASWGDSGGLIYRVKIDDVCPNSLTGDCSSAESEDLYLMFHKATFDAEPVLVSIQKDVGGSTGGKAHFVQSSTSNQHAVDSLGNQLNLVGNNFVYRQVNSSVAVDLTSILPVSANSFRTKPTVTPYGFATIATTGGNFATGTNTLVFVQSEQVT